MDMKRRLTPSRWALDTEDDSEGEVLGINLYNGQRHVTFLGHERRPEAWAFIGSIAPAQVWACNMEYDLVNVYGDWVGKLTTLQYVKSGLMRASLREARVQFLDTLRHWPISVEGMGERLGLPKLPSPFKDRKRQAKPGECKLCLARVHDAHHRLEVVLCPRCVEYMQRDTEVVWRFTGEMIQRYEKEGLTVKPTLPGMALQLFAKRFYRRQWERLPGYLLDFFRRGYYGGRTEVYREGEVSGPINHYDVNSLFPSVMADRKYPDLREWTVTTTPRFELEGMAHVTLRVPETFYPLLPTRYDGEVIFPWGRLMATWTYPEIREALAQGATIDVVHDAIEFSRWHRPFGAYVAYCYSQRQQSRDELDSVYWKLFMNSLYGKFGQSNGGLVTIFDDEEKEVAADRLPAHVNVIWSAYVTAYARLVLHRLLREAGERQVYYTDTDSLFTPRVFKVGRGLGELKLEGVRAWMHFAGKKLYMMSMTGHTIEDDGRCRVCGGDGSESECITAKAKGVQRGVALDFIRHGRAVFRRPARLRESRRNFVQPNVWYEVEKKLEAEIIARQVTRSGWTEPLEWDGDHPK